MWSISGITDVYEPFFYTKMENQTWRDNSCWGRTWRTKAWARLLASPLSSTTILYNCTGVSFMLNHMVLFPHCLKPYGFLNLFWHCRFLHAFYNIDLIYHIDNTFSEPRKTITDMATPPNLLIKCYGIIQRLILTRLLSNAIAQMFNLPTAATMSSTLEGFNSSNF